MDRSVPIDVELIFFITGLPSNGEKLTQYIYEKMKENLVSKPLDGNKSDGMQTHL
jgi:hypothetical protein